MNPVKGCHIILIIIGISVTANGHFDDHPHHHVEKPLFDLILKELNINQIYLNNLENVLSHLDFTDCDSPLPEKFNDCHKCLTAEDLYKMFDMSTSSLVTESTFTKMAKFIVYFLTPEKQASGRPVFSWDVCTQIFNSFGPSSLYSRNFSSNGVYTTEEDVTEVLKQVNHGRHFPNTTGCFSSHDIVHQVGVAHEDVYGTLVFTEQQFDQACLAIILNLLQHKCIINSNPHHVRLPPRDFFINYLYGKFGHDGHIPLEQLEKLLTDLGVGQHEENSHEEHSHKHRRSISENLSKQELRQRVVRNVVAEKEDHKKDHEKGHEEGSSEFNHTCYSTEELLDIYSVKHGEGVTVSQFKDICPAIIQQLYAGVCAEKVTETNQLDYSQSQVWGYGLLAVTIISLLSIIGISVIPVMRKSLYKKVLAFLVAFAVGTLAGDGIMHLLPHALRIHQHGDEASSEVWDWFWKLLVVLGGIYGFYLFETIMHFVIERKQKGHIKHTRSHNTDVGSTCRMMETHEMKSSAVNQMYENLQEACHKHHHHHHHHHNIHEVSSPFLPDDDNDIESHKEDNQKQQSHKKDHKEAHQHAGCHHEDNKHTGHSHQDGDRNNSHIGHSHEHHHGQDDHAGHSHQAQRRGNGHIGHGHCDDHGGKSHEGHSHQHDGNHRGQTRDCNHGEYPSELFDSDGYNVEGTRINSYGELLEFTKPSKWNCSFDFSNVSSMAWTVIIGDTLHNISDGLAIGAAFADMKTNGPSIGISTALAVFCHELPHELGDFAVLLQAGMSVKMAILFNFLSACSCYIGLVIGILIGQDSDVRFWIFAVTAGMFIYVALVDMLPELMHSDELHSEPLVTFLLQNLGIISGFCLMILMARYEERIALAF